MCGRQLRASDFVANLGQNNNPQWKTVAWDETGDRLVVPRGSIGFRWGEDGRWNLEPLDAKGEPVSLALSLLGRHDDVARVAFPYFGGIEHQHFPHVKVRDVLYHHLPAKRLKRADGSTVLAVTVFDLVAANHGIDRGLQATVGGSGTDDGATDYDQPSPIRRPGRKPSPVCRRPR